VSAFSKIRLSLGKSSLLKRQHKRNRNRIVHNFNTARDTALVFDIADEENFRLIKEFSKFLEKLGIKTDLLGYVPDKEIPGGLLLWENCEIFCMNDLDFYFRPKTEPVQKFINHPYDILFDLSMNNFFPLTYTTVLSQARFKTGRYKESLNDSDLMINIDGEPSLGFLIEQTKNYVSILNNPKGAEKMSTL